MPRAQRTQAGARDTHQPPRARPDAAGLEAAAAQRTSQLRLCPSRSQRPTPLLFDAPAGESARRVSRPLGTPSLSPSPHRNNAGDVPSAPPWSWRGPPAAAASGHTAAAGAWQYESCGRACVIATARRGLAGAGLVSTCRPVGLESDAVCLLSAC